MLDQGFTADGVVDIAEVTDRQQRPFLQSLPFGIAERAATTIQLRQALVEQPANLLQTAQAHIARRQTDASQLFGVMAHAFGDSLLIQYLQNTEHFGNFRFQRRDLVFRYEHGC
ncbi:MAG: hypothetical protein EKK71_08000 [Candidatus Competibacteraceae bacterium]|nr:MAG: hypothetical protein EKK71_08000 [Candidatus Competibacteraceae bacterium]